MDDTLTVSDLGFLLSALEDVRRARQFSNWISEEIRLNSLARDRALNAKLIALRDQANRALDDGPGPDDGLTAADIALLFSVLADSRRVSESADWISEEARQASLDRIRALEQKLIALRDAAGREPGL